MNITVYTKNHCPNCEFVKRLLTQKNLPFQAVNVDHPDDRTAFLNLYPRARQMPVVVIDGKPVDDLTELSGLEMQQ